MLSTLPKREHFFAQSQLFFKLYFSAPFPDIFQKTPTNLPQNRCKWFSTT